MPTHLVRLVVEHDQVSVTDVEARQMLTRILGIKDVLVDNKGSATSIGCTTTVWREGIIELNKSSLVAEMVPVL